MFYIKNHSTPECFGPITPWSYVPEKPRPEFADKDAFRKWCMHPQTDHVFYTAYEGLNPGVRISDENPAIKMVGLVADFDSEVLDGDWEALKLRGSPDFQPSYGSLSFSGNARLVWLFEEPIFVYEAHAHQAFLKRMSKELKLTKLLPGFDDGAYAKVALTYELGTQWRELGGTPIRKESLNLWLYEAGKQGRWASSGEIVVPLEKVRAKMDEKYPGRWSGDFAEGARGARFWDMTADNATSAVVRETGMQCFTGDQSFVTWRDIFGHRFVEEFEEDRISAAVAEVYFDGRHYWRQIGKQWKLHAKEDMVLHLKVACGLLGAAGRDAASQVEQALYHIQKHNRVDAALPLVHQQQGIVFRQAERILNISACTVVPPLEGIAGPWGEGFPFIADYLGSFFTDTVQFERFIAWLRRFYESAHQRDLMKGQSIFLVGPVQTGKTLLTNALIGELLGGSMDASSFLLGETSFNSSIYSTALWTVDDSTPGNDAKTHAKFSANVKKVTANQNFEFLAKFRDAFCTRWLGRIAVTLNDDAESLRILPDAETSILDKVMFFRVADRKFSFSPNAHEVIKRELPAFARWLLDWEVPAHCIGDGRYGVPAFHDEMLLGEARRSGRSGEFRELLDSFKTAYFANTADDHWEGTSTELLSSMSQDSVIKDIVYQQRLSPTGVGREMRKLQALGYSLGERNKDGRKLWRIEKKDEEFKEAA